MNPGLDYPMNRGAPLRHQPLGSWRVLWAKRWKRHRRPRARHRCKYLSFDARDISHGVCMFETACLGEVGFNRTSEPVKKMCGWLCLGTSGHSHLKIRKLSFGSRKLYRMWMIIFLGHSVLSISRLGQAFSHLPKGANGNLLRLGRVLS